MSVDSVSAAVSRIDERIAVSTWLSKVVGDTRGTTVFLAAVVVLGGLWRIDFLLNDSVTVGNLLVNVADGQLAVIDVPYSLTAGEQPGLVEVGGELYGRNYGQVYLAVPILWFLDVTAGLVDLRLLIAAGWSLSLLGLARTSSRLLDRPVLADAGAVLALATFGISTLVATEIGWIAGPTRPVVAIELSTLLLAALAATISYRLLAWAHDQRVGLIAGFALILATPIGFWGTFAKRHVLSATVLLLVCYLFAVSRTGRDRSSLLARAGAYGTIGLFSSVHAFEAAFALAVLVPLDLLTAPSNDRRSLTVVGVLFALSLVPMLATNTMISGDPLQPPRTLPGAEGGLSLDPAEVPVDGSEGAGGTGGSGGGGTGGGGAGGTGGGLPFATVLSPLFGVFDRVLWILAYMHGAVVAGIAASTELERLYHVFVRSGWIPGIRYQLTGFETLELAFLEVLPLAGALLALPVLVVDRARAIGGSALERLRTSLANPVRQTDLLVAGLAITLVLVYLPRIPLYAMVTLRYIVPVMPLVLYAVLRLSPVRAAIADAPRALGVSYLATLAVGGIGFLLALVVLDPALGEALQLHAIVGLVAGFVVAGAMASWPLHRRARVVSVAIATAAGATTLFLALSALAYFETGNHALDLVRLVAETLPAVG